MEAGEVPLKGSSPPPPLIIITSKHTKKIFQKINNPLTKKKVILNKIDITE